MRNQLEFLQISCSLSESLGGPSRVVSETHSRLARNFKSAKLVVFGDSGTVSQAEVFPTLFNNRYGIPRKLIWNKAIRSLRSSEVILIHGFYTFVTLYALLYGKKHAKYWLMPHGSLEEYQNFKSNFIKFLFRYIFLILVRKRDFSFAVATEQERVSVVKQYPEFRIEILGIGIEFFGEPTIRQNDANALNLVCISRIATKKRIDLCIRAIKLLRDEGIIAELHILGTGDVKLTKSLKELVHFLDLVQAVHFYGHVARDDIQNILPKMHIFLLPSENENFAIAVAEAISDGLPTVVSKYVAMHTFVEKNSTGIVISDLSAESLTRAILKVKINIERYSTNAINSRFQLTWDTVIKNWERLICH